MKNKKLRCCVLSIVLGLLKKDRGSQPVFFGSKTENFPDTQPGLLSGVAGGRREEEIWLE